MRYVHNSSNTKEIMKKMGMELPHDIFLRLAKLRACHTDGDDSERFIARGFVVRVWQKHCTKA